MNTIEHAMETETEQHEKTLAMAWHCGTYTEAQAKMSAELRSLNFVNITLERSYLYELDAKAGRNSWN